MGSDDRRWSSVNMSYIMADRPYFNKKYKQLNKYASNFHAKISILQVVILLV